MKRYGTQELCSSKSSWRPRLKRHWHCSGVSRPREVSPKPPPGLEAGPPHLLSNSPTPEPLPAGLRGQRKRSSNHSCLQSAWFVCPAFIHEATLGLRSIPVARAGTQSDTPGGHPGSENGHGANRQARGRPKRCSNPASLSTPAPYLSLKGILKPFKMASSGFQGDGAKVITAMETLSLA